MIVFAGVVLFFAALIANSIWITQKKKARKEKRQDSLTKDAGGGWYWNDYNGTQCSSKSHPARKNGEWETEDATSNDSGGWFDGGDGGGGDGGGD